MGQTGSSIGGLGSQVKRTFGLVQVSALVALVSLGGTAFFASTTGRVCALVGLVAGAVAYFAKRS